MRKILLRSILPVGVFAFAGIAHADDFVTAIINNAAFGNGPIQSWSLDLTSGVATAAGSFIPSGAVPGGPNGATPNGRAVSVTNTQFYYTELSGNGFGATVAIETGLYQTGAGGPDNGALPNPTPGQGVAGLRFATGPTGGDLYVLGGYFSAGPFVYIMDPATGKILQGPVHMQTDPGADGFTLLPNGNYLINEGNGINAYDQYNPTTGARISGTTVSAPGCTGSPLGLNATGVDTDGTHLFFDCEFSGQGIVETDLSGNLIHQFVLPGSFGNGIGLSIIHDFDPPPPEAPEPASVWLSLAGAGLISVKVWRSRRSV